MVGKIRYLISEAMLMINSIASAVFLEGKAADTVRDSTRFKHGYRISGLDVSHQVHCLVSLLVPASPLLLPSFLACLLESPTKTYVSRAVSGF